MRVRLEQLQPGDRIVRPNYDRVVTVASVRPRTPRARKYLTMTYVETNEELGDGYAYDADSPLLKAPGSWTAERDYMVERLSAAEVEAPRADHEFVRKPHRSYWAGCAVCGHQHNVVDPAPRTVEH
jgi:hypothetical protein